MGAIPMDAFRGVGQGHSGDWRHGLGKKRCCKGLGQGQEDLEPGPPGFQDKYVQTTKKATTVISKPQGVAPVQRRVDLTRLVEEIEFLAGTPGVHPRALAQKIWNVRRRLMGSSGWQWASYSIPGSKYDTRDDLVSRLEAVERVLGIDKVSPKVMSAFYGMGGLGGLGGSGYTRWGEYSDPIETLAAYIRTAMCTPRAFCCPQGTIYQDPYYEEEFEPEPEPFPPEPVPEPKDDKKFFTKTSGGGGGAAAVKKKFIGLPPIPPGGKPQKRTDPVFPPLPPPPVTQPPVTQPPAVQMQPGPQLDFTSPVKYADHAYKQAGQFTTFQRGAVVGSGGPTGGAAVAAGGGMLGSFEALTRLRGALRNTRRVIRARRR